METRRSLVTDPPKGCNDHSFPNEGISNIHDGPFVGSKNSSMLNSSLEIKKLCTSEAMIERIWYSLIVTVDFRLKSIIQYV